MNLNSYSKEFKMPYGYDDAAWEAAKNEAKKILAQFARLEDTIPYSEFVSRIGSISLNAHDPRLSHFLSEISSEESEAGRGMLTVLVVHKEGDRQPGPGFFDLAQRLGRDTSDITACWIEEFKKVCAAWAPSTQSESE